jgi:hypothetical protein
MTRIYPQQATETMKGIAYLESVPQRSDHETPERRRTRVRYDLQMHQDYWDGKVFGEKRPIGWIEFLSPSDKPEFINATDWILLLDHDRSVPLQLAGSNPCDDGTFRVVART